jgi:adenine specific DNA methylase Mod
VAQLSHPGQIERVETELLEKLEKEKTEHTRLQGIDQQLHQHEFHSASLFHRNEERPELRERKEHNLCCCCWE